MPKTKTTRFKAGRSGNPNGRPRGSSNHETDLRQMEEQGMMLAANTADTIAEMLSQALTEAEEGQLIPLVKTIVEVAKEGVAEGEIGPSSVAVLRGWFNDVDGGGFFEHVGLSKNCSWENFRKHYTTRGRIDHERHASDLMTFSPIAQRIAELRKGVA